MNSLTAHLNAGPRHGRLRFHPECPFCQLRRADRPLVEPVVPARLQAGALLAAIGAGTLAPPGDALANANPSDGGAVRPSQVATPMPPVATEPVESDAAPTDEAPGVRDWLTNPDAGTDGGGEDVAGDEEAGEAPVIAPPTTPPAPVATPPAEFPAGDPVAPQQPAPAPVLSDVPTSPAPERPAEASPAPGVAAPEAQLTQPGATNPPRQRNLRVHLPPRRAESHGPASSQAPVTPPEGARIVAAATAPETTTPEGAEPMRPMPADEPEQRLRTARITGDTYVVREGDTLSSIAGRILGTGDAAQIKREVDRLWALNADRIGTGDLNLIYAGTVLKLR